MKFIPCDEKTLVGAKHSTGKMKSSAYADNKGVGITKSGKIRSKKDQIKKRDKNINKMKK